MKKGIIMAAYRRLIGNHPEWSSHHLSRCGYAYYNLNERQIIDVCHDLKIPIETE